MIIHKRRIYLISCYDPPGTLAPESASVPGTPDPAHLSDDDEDAGKEQ
jgi:hypothetical protein